MDKHIGIVGGLFVAMGAIKLLAAGIVMVTVMGGGLLSQDMDVLAVTSTVAISVSSLLLFLALPSLIGGIGLLKRRSWARILVVVLGILNLPGVPFGTALGIYTLWVLLKPESEQILSAARPA